MNQGIFNEWAGNLKNVRVILLMIFLNIPKQGGRKKGEKGGGAKGGGAKGGGAKGGKEAEESGGERGRRYQES